MASQQPVSDNDPLRQPSRYITDHDAEGNAIFADLPEVVPLEPLGNLAWNVSYTTFETPVKFTDQKDKMLVSFHFKYLGWLGVVSSTTWTSGV